MNKDSIQTIKDKKYKCYKMLEGIALRLGINPDNYGDIESLNSDIHSVIHNLLIMRDRPNG